MQKRVPEVVWSQGNGDGPFGMSPKWICAKVWCHTEALWKFDEQVCSHFLAFSRMHTTPEPPKTNRVMSDLEIKVSWKAGWAFTRDTVNSAPPFYPCSEAIEKERRQTDGNQTVSLGTDKTTLADFMSFRSREITVSPPNRQICPPDSGQHRSPAGFSWGDCFMPRQYGVWKSRENHALAGSCSEWILEEAKPYMPCCCPQSQQSVKSVHWLLSKLIIRRRMCEA